MSIDEPLMLPTIFSHSPKRIALTLMTFLLALLMTLSDPVAASDKVARVEVGAYINDISNIDITTGQATIDLYLWIVSPEPFDATKGFDITNGKGTVHLVESTARDDGRAYQLLRISADSKQHYKTQDFPFDTQTIRLSFDFDPRGDNHNLEVTADTKNSGVSTDIVLPGWSVDQLQVSATRQNYPASWGNVIGSNGTVSYPHFSVSVEVERHSMVYLIRYFSVIIFAGLLAMLGLFLRPSETARISLGIGAYISLSASNLVIANKLPITDSLGFSDDVILLTGALILSTVIYSLTLYHVQSTNPDKAGSIDRVARIAFPSIWITSLLVLFFT